MYHSKILSVNASFFEILRKLGLWRCLSLSLRSVSELSLLIWCTSVYWWALFRGCAISSFSRLQDGRVFEVGALELYL